jgi:hypothetical protein
MLVPLRDRTGPLNDERRRSELVFALNAALHDLEL